jgi:hypothetical protein
MRIKTIKTFKGVVGIRTPIGDSLRGPKMFIDRGTVLFQKDVHTNTYHLSFMSNDTTFEPTLVLPLTLVDHDQTEIKTVHDKNNKGFKKGRIKLLTTGPVDTRYYTGCEEIVVKLGVSDASQFLETITQYTSAEAAVPP